MNGMTLHQLRCFEAVVRAGGFQAAAKILNRTHPTIFVAIKALEVQLGVSLFDRSGYRVALTPQGRSFHEKAGILLQEARALEAHAEHMAKGEETALSVIVGDSCPLPETLGLLKTFFENCPDTRLDLYFEALGGPIERLLDNDADLILHHIDKSDMRLEFIDLRKIRFIPVAADRYLDFDVSNEVTPEQMRPYVQCVIRDTARNSPLHSYYMIEGARSWTVGDQLMKKEIILQGMGWGHLPEFMIEQELQDGRLIPITGKHLAGGEAELVAARLRDHLHGPIANRLWQYISEQA
jgi:DNA-binding transcriptional LysR family regulator